MEERKERLLKVINALSGLRYSDWRTLNDIIDLFYRRKLNGREHELLSTPIELDEIEAEIKSLSE